MVDLAVIGGGAAGLAAAVAASALGDRVIILEAGNAIGKKILASGNGRCNLLNTGDPRYYGDTDFAREIIRRCDAEAQRQFWHGIGLLTAEEAENRVYPCTFHSSTVLQVLKTALEMNAVKISLNSPVQHCCVMPDRTFQIQGQGTAWQARRILIATGGPAGKKAGDESFGYRMLQETGHRIHALRPALVPLNTDAKSISGLSGIRIRCKVSLMDENRQCVHSERGELLFTAYGVSGICVMQCARFVHDRKYHLEIDLADRLGLTDTEIREELACRKKRFDSLSPEFLLMGILHPKLAYAVMKQAGVKLEGEPMGDLDDDQIDRVEYVLRHYRADIHSTRDMTDAQVTSGGAECAGFRTDNMESRIIPGLHAAGEILNVDGDCGGFNLMFAFGSGILAGLNGRKPVGYIRRKEREFNEKRRLEKTGNPENR